MRKIKNNSCGSRMGEREGEMGKRERDRNMK
jgi:hypothetical protein